MKYDLLGVTIFSDEVVGDIFSDRRFKSYVVNLKKNFTVSDITIRAVEWFGERPGFIYTYANVRNENGIKLPGAAMIRGDGIAILPVFITPSGKYTSLVSQARPAVGKIIEELPAGMDDKEIPIISIAIEELHEEISSKLNVRACDFKTLFCGYTSPGGCDEQITIVSIDIYTTDIFLRTLDKSTTGLKKSGEDITVKVVPLDYLQEIPDMKTRLAYELYSKKEPP